MPVGGLAKALGLSRTALNHHLQMLRLAGVVTHRRERQNVFYALAQGLVRDFLLRHVQP
jgi:biotin operon repressor